MPLSQEEFELTQSFAMLDGEPARLANEWGEQRFFKVRSECRQRYLIAGEENKLRVTGFGAAMIVAHGYRGTLENVVPRNRSNLRGKLKGNYSADKRAGE